MNQFLQDRALAVGSLPLTKFKLVAKHVALTCNGMIDAGLVEGKILTRSTFLALTAGLVSVKTDVSVFDPIDFTEFNKVNWKNTGYPKWAIESALAFHKVCLENKLSIRFVE